MSDKTCGNCRDCGHWADEDSEDLGFRSCGLVEHWSSSTGYNEAYTERVIEPRSRHLKAFAEDASGYSAYLMTAPDFGCVQFKAKEGPA